MKENPYFSNTRFSKGVPVFLLGYQNNSYWVLVFKMGPVFPSGSRFYNWGPVFLLGSWFSKWVLVFHLGPVFSKWVPFFQVDPGFQMGPGFLSGSWFSKWVLVLSKWVLVLSIAVPGMFRQGPGFMGSFFCSRDPQPPPGYRICREGG